MRVLLLPADHYGCGHYRLLFPMEVLGDVEFTVADGLPARRPRTSFVVKGVDPLNVDVVVLQRPLLRTLVECIPFIQAQGIAVVVDIDDDFTCLHHRHTAWAPSNPKLSPNVNWRHLMRACSLADLVTVSTPALAERFGSRGNAHLLRNCVPERYLSVPTLGQSLDPSLRLGIGWGGYTHSHPDDLKTTNGGVALALQRSGGRFICIGDGNGVDEELGISPDDVEVVGGVPLDEYPAAIGRFDVGIVPLQVSRFNAAKSYLKGLEYAALGVPFVASDTPEYRYLADELGMGLIAAPRQRDWARGIAQAAEMRDQGWGEHYRELIRDDHTYEGNAWRWTEAWARAMQKAAIRCAA